MRWGRQHGFTLIEVLIASFILFIALSTFTLIFRSSLLSTGKAQETVEESVTAISIADKVAQDLQNLHAQSEAQGSGVLLGIAYRWKASVKQAAHPPARYFGQELIQAEHQAKLWRVELTLGGDVANQRFQYEEITW